MATERKSASNNPPSTFQLNEVSISIKRHAGAIKGSTAQQIQLRGEGSSLLERNGDEFIFTYVPERFITLINTLYSLRFFDLPSRYNIKHSVFLKEGGAISTNALHMVDASNTTVCFNLPNYEKCVTFGIDGPDVLQRFTNELFIEVDKLSALN